MRIFIIILSFILFPLISFAEIIIPKEVFMVERMKYAQDANHFLGFQIIQEQITFNNSNIRKASMLGNGKGGFGGLLIEMKPKAAHILQHMTEGNVGKKVNFILDGKIISTSVMNSPLANRFIITKITKEQAEMFLKSLNLAQNFREHPVVATTFP